MDRFRSGFNRLPLTAANEPQIYIPGQRPRGRLRGAGAEAPACQGAQGAQCLGKPAAGQGKIGMLTVGFAFGAGSVKYGPPPPKWMVSLVGPFDKKGTLKRRDMDPGTS